MRCVQGSALQSITQVYSLPHAVPFLYISCKFLKLAGQFQKGKEGGNWLNKTQIIFEENGTSEVGFFFIATRSQKMEGGGEVEKRNKEKVSAWNSN